MHENDVELSEMYDNKLSTATTHPAAYQLTGRPMRSWRELDFIGPRTTIVLSPARGDGKTTVALRLAGRACNDATHRTAGVDVVAADSRGSLWDTPPPPTGVTMHPAVAGALVRDATHAIVVHRNHAAGTLRLVHALHNLGIAVVVVPRNEKAAPDWRIAGAAHVAHTPVTWPFHAVVLAAGLGNATMPRGAHAAMCLLWAALLLIPCVRVRKGPDAFLQRAREVGTAPYPAPTRQRDRARPARAAFAALALLAARACAAASDTVPLWAVYALPGRPIAQLLRFATAQHFLRAGASAHLAAAALFTLTYLARWPMPRRELAVWLAAAAAIGVHAGPATVFVVMQGNRGDPRDAALLAAGALARDAHIAVVLAVVALGAMEDNLPRMMQQPGFIIPWVLMLLYF